MAHVGLYIDEATGDLALTETGDLRVARSALAVAQHARQRILLHRGEWFLNTDAGTPWFEDIMGNAYDGDLAEALVLTRLAETDGVTGVNGISTRFDLRSRRIIMDRMNLLTVYDGGIA